jgi:hypothetical protein
MRPNPALTYTEVSPSSDFVGREYELGRLAEILSTATSNIT